MDRQRLHTGLRRTAPVQRQQADLLGRRPVFLGELGVFTLAPLLGGRVDSGPPLIASRFVRA